MVQMFDLPAKQNPLADVLGAFGQGAGQGLSFGLQKNFEQMRETQAAQKDINALQNALKSSKPGDFGSSLQSILTSNARPEAKKLAIETLSQVENYRLKQQEFSAEQEKAKRDQDLVNNILQGNANQPALQNQQNLPLQEQPNAQLPNQQPQQKPNIPQKKPLPFSKEQLLAASVANKPTVVKAMEAINDQVQKENEIIDKQAQKARDEFVEERKYHSEYTKKDIEEAEGIRRSLPKKEFALDLARNAIQSNEVGAFSRANLAERTGIPELQSAKGAQLITAGKENLLSNMDRVSAKAQNIWFEQRLNSMFPKIGQSPEANLTINEMLEGEAAMDRAYLKEFDRLKEEDIERYGFERKGLAERARKNVEHIDEEIFARTNYRLKEIQEQEWGEHKLKAQVGKKVVKGTPLTLFMAKAYKDKYGNNALKEAKKNGYFVPTKEDFMIYEMQPSEYRKELSK